MNIRTGTPSHTLTIDVDEDMAEQLKSLQQPPQQYYAAFYGDTRAVAKIRGFRARLGVCVGPLKQPVFRPCTIMIGSNLSYLIPGPYTEELTVRFGYESDEDFINNITTARVYGKELRPRTDLNNLP